MGVFNFSWSQEEPAASGNSLAVAAPIAGVAIAGGCFFIMRQEAHPIDWAPLLLQACPTGTPVAYGARTAWLAATYALSVTGLVGLATVVVWVARALRDPSCPALTASLLKGASIAALLIAAASQIVPRGAGPPLLEAIELRDPANVKATFRVMNGVYIFGGFASALGFSATLVPVASRCRDFEVLADAVRRQRLLLYVTSLVLASASVWMNILWSWPRIWARDPATATTIEQLALQVSGSWGAIFTIFTLTVFSFGSIALRDWIEQVGRESYPDVKERRDRLEEFGVRAPWTAEIVRVGAVLGPALAGGPGAMLFEAITK